MSQILNSNLSLQDTNDTINNFEGLETGLSIPQAYKLINSCLDFGIDIGWEQKSSDVWD